MSVSLRRKGAIGSIGDGLAWLRRNPVLIPVFFLYGLVGYVGEIIGPAGTALTIGALLAVFYVDGVVHVIAAQEAAGEAGDAGRASAAVLDRYLSLLGAGLVYGLAVFVGFLLLVLPGIYLALRLSLAFPACVIDDQDAFESLGTSWTVASGNLAKLFGITLVGALTVVVASLAALWHTGLGDGFYRTYLAASAVATAVVGPVVQFGIARVYLENRPVDASSATERGGPEPDAWRATVDGTGLEGDGDRWGDDGSDWVQSDDGDDWGQSDDDSDWAQSDDGDDWAQSDDR